MSIAKVWFKAELQRQGLTGLMGAFARSIDKDKYLAIDEVKKTVIGHLGGRRLIYLLENDIEMANTEAWNAGITWAKKYIQTGYGAGEKPWDDIPEEKRA